MFGKKTSIFLFFGGFFALAYGDTFAECEGKDQTYVELQEDCSLYIFCHGDDSFSDSCPEDSPYFSTEEQTCDRDRKVCKGRAINKEITNPTTDEPEISTVASSSDATKSSTAYTITIPTAAVSSSSPSSAATALSSTNTPGLINATELPTAPTTFPAPILPSSCPSVDNPNRVIFLPHAKSCSEYFLCYRGERLPMHCSNLLHFDVRQQKCDYPENVKCQMMDVASPREQCLPHTFDFYPHPGNCNYYYQCILGYLRVMQCPWNMGWHYEKRACVRRSLAKCYSSFARSISK